MSEVQIVRVILGIATIIFLVVAAIPLRSNKKIVKSQKDNNSC